jgi:hypothetical protein
MRRRNFLSAVLVGLASERLCFAYLDPGTGMSYTAGLGAWIAGAAGLVVTAAVFGFRRIVSLVKKLFGGPPSA